MVAGPAYTRDVGSDTTAVCRLGYLAKEEILLRLWNSIQIFDCTKAAAALQIF